MLGSSGKRILRDGAVILATCAGLTPAMALPPDPQRPLTARTCAEALTRHEEALAGNPLISDQEIAVVRARTRAQVLRLCGPDVLKPGPDCLEFQSGQTCDAEEL